MAWGDSRGHWGDPDGAWGVDITEGLNKFQSKARKFATVITHGGKFDGKALKFATTITQNMDTSGVFAVSSPWFYDLTITDLPGSLGTFGSKALKYNVLSMGGFESTSGTFIKTAHKYVLVINPLTYDCVVICTENAANTEYVNFDFDSIAEYRGQIIMVNSDGVFSYSGSDDDGANIDALIRTLTDDFESSNLKTVTDCYVGLIGGEATVKMVRDGVVGDAQTLTATGTNLRNRRVSLGKGNRNRYWAVQLENVNGSGLDIDEIELDVYELKRKLTE